MRWALLVAAVILAVVILAGCTGADSVTQASTLQERALKADAMLASPPGSEVEWNGQTKEFTLYVHRMPEHSPYPGATMSMWGFSFEEDETTASVPGPEIRVKEGDKVVIRFRSTVPGFNHTLHFHGQNVPNDQDGVPYLTQQPIEASDEWTYEFVARNAGTYWYHCHVDAQHHTDMGMYGALIVEPADPSADPRFDVEETLILDDMDRFHLEGGATPTSGSMPQGGDLYSYEQFLKRQANDAATRNSQVNGAISQTNASVRPNRGWYPVTYAPYTADYNTYVINGVSFPYTEPIVVDEGQILRLRIIQAGNSVSALHLHGHHMLVTHKDGVLLDSPYWADTILIGPGERYDVYVKLDNPGLWELHDHIGGHTQNDNVFPGGAMTVLCYQSVADCNGGGHSHSGAGTSGALLSWPGMELP